MIDGVNVLYEYARASDVKCVFAFGMCIFSVIVLIVTTYNFSKSSLLDRSEAIIFTVLYLVLCALGWLGVSRLPNENYIKATISEEVTVSDLLSRYKIDKIEGDIYILKVIEEEETE